jgi:hypothetical protein
MKFENEKPLSILDESFPHYITKDLARMRMGECGVIIENPTNRLKRSMDGKKSMENENCKNGNGIREQIRKPLQGRG